MVVRSVAGEVVMNTPKNPLHVRTRLAAINLAVINGGMWFFIEETRETKFIASGKLPAVEKVNQPKPIDFALPLRGAL